MKCDAYSGGDGKIKHKDAGNLLCAFEDTNKYILGAGYRCINVCSNDPVEVRRLRTNFIARAWTRRAACSMRC